MTRIIARLGGTVSLCLALTVPAAAQTTIDFNDGTAMGIIGTFYSSLGVTFQNARWDAISLTGEGSIGAGGLKLASASGGFAITPVHRITLVFSQAISAMSLALLDLGANGFQFDAYDAQTGGNLVAQTSMFGTSVGVGNFQTMTLTGSGIHRVEMYQPLAPVGDGIVLDNLSFTPENVVPEPATVILLASGLAGIAGAAFRRRKKVIAEA
jgi:hypothetical protein